MGNGVYEAQGSFFGLSALGAWPAGGGLWPTCFVNAPALLHRTSFDEAMMPFDGSFSMTSWAATSKSPPNPQWHGPPGGHDHDNVQGHRIWDVWDVVHIMTVFLKELFLHQMPYLNMMCRSWSFTILGVQLAALLLFLLGAVSSRRTKRRLGPMPARLCGALAAMALCNTVQAAPGECHRLQHGRPQEASDLELWAAGQRTLREQLQDSVDRWIALRPLQHNSGEARPPTYEVTADDPLHALPEEDITSVHVTCWVTSPYFEAEVVDMELPFPTTLPRLRDALKDSCSVMPEWAGDFIPTTPQIGRDYASFVAVPSWIRETTKAALLDCSAIDAGVFAAYLEEPVTRTSVMMALAPGAPDGLQLYAYGSDRPMRSDRTYPTVHGGVIRVVRDGGTPRWSDDLHQRLGAPERWNPQAAMPFPLGRLHTVYQSADDQVVEEIETDDERTLEVAAEEALHYEHGECWVMAPQDRVRHLAHQGRRIWGQLAVMDGYEQHAPEAPIIFLDLRGVAHFPQWAQLPNTTFRPVEYYQGLHMPDLPDWVLMVEGGEPLEDGESIAIHSGDTLTFFLRPRTSSDSADSMDSDSDDQAPSDDDGSSPGPDNLPGSSDFSASPPPDDGTRRGAPPPEPVDRSRSPRRSPLLLHEHLPPPVIDIDKETVALPHGTCLLGALTTAWHPTWANPCWDEIQLPATTAQHMSQVKSWQTAEWGQATTQPVFHLYTDGAADIKRQVSGTAVVILLQLGACYVMLGLIGEQLAGSDSTPWEPSPPLALHAEQVAITTAILWAIQMRALLPTVTCKLWFDCTAAGWTAAGTWGPGDSMGHKMQHLEMLARALPGIELSFDHVSGHSGHPWNDLADYVAKQSAKGRLHWASPPATLCHTVMNAELSWIAVELDARRHHALPIFDGTLTWRPGQHDAFMLQPGDLIPVDGPGDSHSLRGDTMFEVSIATINIQGLRGKFKYVEDQLHELSIQVALLQETKSAEGVCMSQRYLRLHTSADRHWGVAIWVHRQLGLLATADGPLQVQDTDFHVIVEHKHLLIVQAQLDQLKVALISAHCPHTARQEERAGFLDRLRDGLRRIKHAHLILGGADFNARVPLSFDGVSGSLEHGDPDTGGWQVAQILADAGIWLPSTYHSLHVGDSTTYIHPSGTPHRIDYTLIGGSAVVRTVRSQVEEDFDNASPQEDHKLLKLCLQGLLGASSRRTSLKRPRYDCDKLLDSASKERLRQRLRDFPQPPWQMHPDQHCKQLEDYLRDVLSTDYSLPPRKIGSSYIPEKVWKWREQKLSFKLRTRGRLNLWAALLGRAFNQWKAGVDYGVVWLLHKEGFLYQLAAAAVKYVSGRIRREINIAKNAFLTKVATEGHQGAAKVLQRVKQAGIGGKNAKPTTRPLPLLYHPDDGTAITTRKQRDDVWLLHFGRQEQGTVKPTSRFIREAGELLCHEDATWSWEHLPTYQDIAAVLRTLPRRKASGLDGIPAELLLSDPSEVSRLLHPLCIKAALHQRQPLQWRGGVLFEAFKKSGLQSDITNYRSLFVSSHLAKTFHRVIRNKAQAFCRDEFHSLHLGSKRQSPVGFASLYVLSHLRRCKQLKCSTSVLYLDISAAYYRLVRELATGDIRHDRTVVSLFQHFGLGEDELRELMQAIQDGGLLSQAGMPDPLRHVARDLHLHTWFVSRFADGSHVCDSRAGSRPGESWADLLYAHIYSLVLHKVHEHVVAEDLGSELRVDMECGIFGSPAEGTPIVATDATWADDSAFPTSDSCPARLLAKTQRMTSLVLGFCANLGMAPNLKLGKTNLMIVLCGRGQQAARRKFFQDGLQTLWLPDLQLQVPVVEQYKHLGGFVDSRLSMLPEVRYRLAQAGSAYDSAKLLLLNNPGLQLRTRAALFETIVTPTLFNIGQWVPGGKAWDRLAAGYNKLMRRLLQREVAGHRIFHLPVLLVPWFTGCWRLELVARRARLSLLVSLAKAGPTLLWAMLQEEGCWLAAVQADLQWFAQDAGDKWPGCDRAAWPEWLHLLRDRQPLFKRHLRKRLALEHAKQSLADAGLVCLWHCFRSLEAKRAEPGKTLRWVCHMCGKAFQTRAALSVHFFKVHSRVADYRYYATGTRCSACGTEYWSNGRLNAHLRASSKCTAILRSRGERSEEVPPGFGSLKRRKADIEQFTLAPPRQGEAQAEYAPPAEVWPKHQTLVYRELCEELFELAHDVNLAQLQEVIANVLARHPVYPDEILQVLDYIKGEIKMLHDVDNQEPWSPAQVSMLYEALERSGQEQWSTQPSSPNESKTGFSLRQFSQSLLEYDWDKGLTELRDRHGTPATVSIRVDDRWEAEWRCHLEKVAVSAVVEDLSIILPEAVQGAWVACLHGNSVRVTAPQSFWRHPIARPLLSCRVLTASN